MPQAEHDPLPPPPEAIEASLRLDNQLCFALYAAAHAMTRAYRPLLGGMSLTYPQYLVLLVLWENGRQTVSDLGDRLRLDSGTLTPLLKRLEAAGLVSRARGRRDEREVEVTLTPAGEGLRAPAAAVREAVVCSLGMSEPEFAALRADLGQLLRRLESGDGVIGQGAAG